MKHNRDGQKKPKPTITTTVQGFPYGAGWPVVTIETTWAVGSQEHVDNDAEATSIETEHLETQLLSIEDVADLLGISIKAVQRLVRNKKLGCIQLTKKKRVYTQALVDQFIRRESGLPVEPERGKLKSVTMGQKPSTKPLPVEEARALLKKVMKRT